MESNDSKTINELQADFNKLISLYFKTPVDVFENILKNSLDKFTQNFSVDKLDIKQPEEILIQFYRILRGSSVYEGSPQIVQVNKFNFADFKKNGGEYKTINFLAENLEKYPGVIKSSILHGSFATKDFVRDFSDLEVIIVLNDEIFSDSGALKRAKEILARFALLCYKIDILAHHEFMFLTEFDLVNYSSIFVPLEVYDHSVVLSGQAKLEIFIKETPEIIRQKLNKTLRIFYDSSLAFKKNGFDPFYFKNALANLMIVPSLVFRVLKRGVYKKDSFSNFKSDFPQISDEALNFASIERVKWRQINFLKLMPNYFFKHFPVSIIRLKIKMNRKIVKMLFFFKSKKEIKHFFTSAEKFSHEVFNTLSNNE